MNILYDDIQSAFLDKISEYNFMQYTATIRTSMVDGYMRRSAASFRHMCKYDLSLCDDTLRAYTANFDAKDVDEIIEILSDGMVLQWLKQYVNQQDNLENAMNTSDYSTYSPAALLAQIGNAYDRLKKEHTQKMREYSYDNNDLTGLHL